MKTYIKPIVKEIELRPHRIMAGSEPVELGSTNENFEAGAKPEDEGESLW